MEVIEKIQPLPSKENVNIVYMLYFLSFGVSEGVCYAFGGIATKFCMHETNLWEKKGFSAPKSLATLAS